MRTIVVGAITLFACRALPPAPMVPFHASTAAEAVDEVTLSLVVGVAMQGLGGVGLGGAIRVERQDTERTALGAELGIGWIDADGTKLWLFALRGYGKSTPRAHDWVALTYGAGVSVLTSGMVSLQLHAGGAIAHPNDYVVPYLSAGLAASLPIIDGAPFGHLDEGPDVRATRERHAREAKGDVPYGPWAPKQPDPVHLRSELYVYGSIGTVVPLGDTGNALSLDFGVAKPLRDDTAFAGLSLADTQH
ncbi:MAG: hypothetical protein ACKV2T_35560 [Kofleriaceae bacterium]